MLNSYNAWIVSIEIQNTLRRINITQYMYMYHFVAIWNKCAKKAWKWSLHTQINDRMVRGVWISEDDSPRLSGGHQVFIIHGNGQQADYPEHISSHTSKHSGAALHWWHFGHDIAVCILVLVEICITLKPVVDIENF